MECGFQIITDSTCDLPKSWVAAHPYITVVDVPVMATRGNESHTFRNLGPDDFGKVEERVKEGFRASTSHPLMRAADLDGADNPNDDTPKSVEEIVHENVMAGKDVIYVVMNGALSSAYDNATPLFEELQQRYKGRGRRIICVDSHCMSTGLALLLCDIADGIEKGTLKDVDQVAKFVEDMRGHIGHYFTWGELSYIKKSGRVSAVQAMIGTILGVRLLCSAQYCKDGLRRLEHVTPSRSSMLKVRGINKWAEVVSIYAKRHIADDTGTIIVAHGNVPRDMEIIRKRLKDYLPAAKILYGEEWRCGAGIQAHGGPTSIHVNFHVDEVESLDRTIEEFEDIVRNLNR